MADISTPGIASGRLDEQAYVDNFSDLHPPLSANKAHAEAERCYFCYDAPCMQACPTSIDIPLFIRQIATANTIGAAETIFASNILGGMCARVCPTETLCEEVCVHVEQGNLPVMIGELQRFATDAAMLDGGVEFDRKAASGKTVAVVGSGPAGLACAHALSANGHDVTIFDKKPKPGGLNEYGLAAYKTTDGFAQREVEFVLSIGGIDVRYGQSLGENFSLKDLSQDFDAVFLGIGLGDTNDLGLGSEPLKGELDAVDYIANLRQADNLASLPVGQNVVVIGGGMTAIDIAMQTKKLGSRSVTIVYRRGPEQMGASAFERELAQTNGIVIEYWTKPVNVLGRNDEVEAIKLERTRLDGKRLSGTGETFVLSCDQVFRAIGQSLESAPLAGSGLEMEGNRIGVDDNRKTSLENVWAGGDCIVGGEDLTVSSVEDGKVAAAAIDRFLCNGKV